MASTRVNKKTVKALRVKNVDAKKFSLGKIQEKFVPVLYNNNTFVCQTPLLEVIEDIKIGQHSLIELNTLFKGDRKNRIHSFFNMIDKIECRMIDLITKHGKWFTKDKTTDTIKVTNKSLVREIPNDGTTFIRWPLNVTEDMFVNKTNTKVSYDSIKKGCLVKIIFELPFLWIKEQQYGLFVRVQKVMVHPPIQKQPPAEYLFENSEASDADIEELDRDTVNIIDRLATEQAPPRPKPTEPKLSVRFMDDPPVELVGTNVQVEAEVVAQQQTHNNNELEAISSESMEYDLTKDNLDINQVNILENSDLSELGTEFEQSLLN